MAPAHVLGEPGSEDRGAVDRAALVEVQLREREHVAGGRAHAAERVARAGEVPALVGGQHPGLGAIVAERDRMQDRVLGQRAGGVGAERLQQMAAQRGVIALAGEHLDEPPEDREAAVAIGVAAAGRERHVARERRQLADVAGERVVAAAGVGEMVAAEARAVGEQVMDAHLALHPGRLGDERGDRPLEDLGPGEREQQRGGVDLGDRAELEDGVDAHARAVAQAGDARGDEHAVPAIADPEHRSGHVEAVDELVQPSLPGPGEDIDVGRVHLGLSIAARPRARCGRPGAAG